MRRLTPIAIVRTIIGCVLTVLLWPSTVQGCTSAIVSGRLTANGRPLMWKNRDTNDLNNRIKRIAAHDGLAEFVGLFDARDRRDTAVWMGFNEHGFAVMNTASYNLNGNVDGIVMDREGVVMRMALERCATVDDFAHLLDTLPRPMGVEANFGVIDAAGSAAYFETGNYGYVRYDMADEPSGILTRTNYSISGRSDEGYGYIRHDNERMLLRQHIEAADITPATFTEGLSRTFFHSVLGRDFSDSEQWVVDQDFIPRRISSASVVVEGVLPGEPAALTTMWVALGYPPCAEVVPTWTGDGGVNPDLCGNGPDNHAALADRANERKAKVFSIRRGNGKHYINLKKLYNSAGTGYCQQLAPLNAEAYRRGYAEIDRRRQALKGKH